jgi:RNA polymerase sigma-70 factor (ECF subfamily)
MRRVYRQWVIEHQDRVWSLARYLLRDAGEAEDAAQEVFVSLWKHRDSIDGQRVGPWLMRVTRNECLDRLRRSRPGEELDDYHAAEGSGPLSDMQRAEVSRWLKLAISKLEEPYRSLVVLRDVQQHSYADVALTMELTMEQVKVYLYRARRQLREQLAEIQP